MRVCTCFKCVFTAISHTASAHLRHVSIVHILHVHICFKYAFAVILYTANTNFQHILHILYVCTCFKSGIFYMFASASHAHDACNCIVGPLFYRQIECRWKRQVRFSIYTKSIYIYIYIYVYCMRFAIPADPLSDLLLQSTIAKRKQYDNLESN